MQVTVDEAFTAIHNCQLLTFAEGEVVGGDMAAYLLRTGAAVTPADDDARDLAENPNPVAPAAEPPAEDATVEAVVEEEPVEAPTDIDVAVSTIDQVLEWVNGDAERAKAASVAEQSRGDKARTRLLAKLDEIAQG